MDRDAELRYWKARSIALEETLRQMRQRLRLLAAVVPLEALEYLDGDLDDLELAARAPALLDGIEDTTELTRAEVSAELALAWKRSAHRDPE